MAEGAALYCQGTRLYQVSGPYSSTAGPTAAGDVKKENGSEVKKRQERKDRDEAYSSARGGFGERTDSKGRHARGGYRGKNPRDSSRNREGQSSRHGDGNGTSRGRANYSVRGRANCSGHVRGRGNVGRKAINSSVDVRSEDDRSVKDPKDNHQTVPKPTSYPKLREWTETMDPTELVNIASNPKNGFFALLEGSDENLNDDKIVLILKTLSKVCAADFLESKKKILITACKSKNFTSRLMQYLSMIHILKTNQSAAFLPAFFENLVEFCSTSLSLAPQTACDNLHAVLTLTPVAVNNVKPLKVAIPEKLNEKVAQLTDQLDHLVKARDRSVVEEKKQSRYDQLHLQAPPNDYRNISIFPLPEDVLAERPAFVRPNIVQGAYQDVGHYLDVQFRLLREDFVSPLREGIRNMHEDKGKKGNVRIYNKVQFKGVHVTRQCPGVLVQFNMKSNIKWERSKRLMYGSLLVFTKDNFRNMLFATVLDRNVEELKNNRIIVNISHEAATEEHKFNVDYTMIESEVYFPSYQHVLAALQRMPSDNFPMSRYIVDVRADTQPPSYLVDVQDCMYIIDGVQVPVMSPDWRMIPQDLGLDASQFRAFQLALTREFVVIQGPPGTGKTYLALKIARALLANVNALLKRKEENYVLEQNRVHRLLRVLNAGRQRFAEAELDPAVLRNLARTPILVVCYTNHALDQFLEGLLGDTNKIIRCGGQSRSEKLKEYNLREMRVNDNWNRTSRSRDLKQQMSLWMGRIKGIESDLKSISSPLGIVSIQSLVSVIREQALILPFMDGKELSSELFVQWLVEGATIFEPADYRRVQAADEMDLPMENSNDEREDLANKMERMRSDEAWEREAADDYDLEVVEKVTIKFSRSCSMIRQRLMEIETHLASGNYSSGHIVWEHEALSRELMYIEYCLQNPPHHTVNVRNLRGVNLWALDFNDRWAVYRHWLHRIRQNVLAELRTIEAQYCESARLLDEIRDEENLQVMRNADIVGMTTTMAAKSQQLLQALRPRIVIVEEAAEVMESHIVVSLSTHCEHLILIGDHKQLRPSTATYRLTKEFKFDVSLFERMLNNGLHCEQLMVQHRMRPEIAQLIVPAIYETLENHPSVLEYSRVRGMAKSLFFFTHSSPEQEITESQTKQNKFEGDMVLALARHILLQGYEPHQLTILTTYSGQMFYMKQERTNYPLLSDVLITIVDNYQGEENDIILLSLVRNNPDKNIGFLKTENRVCVALSRAKHGMYVFGNIDHLTSSSEVWPKIKDVLDEQHAVGEEIVLKCEVHPDQLTAITCAKDFNKVPEGGCQLKCATELACGHVCKILCHAMDRSHKKYRCREACIRVPEKCGLEHQCTRLCYMDCGDCLIPVLRTLPCEHEVTLECHVEIATYKCTVKLDVVGACGHEYTRLCHEPLDSVKCPHPCQVRLDCGHACRNKCHVNDDPDHLEYKCMEQCALLNVDCTMKHHCARLCWEECGVCVTIVKKQGANCNHMHDIQCSVPSSEVKCKKPCKRQIPACGHNCKMKCFEACGGCMEEVVKTIPDCGHSVKTVCKEEVGRRHCTQHCERSTTCGHKCLRPCKAACTTAENCEELVQSSVVPACGHQMKVPCSVNAKGYTANSVELLSQCREKCKALLECQHRCKGTCGQCMQGRIHKGCQEKCGRTLICGHACMDPCAEACSTCKHPCEMRCVHSRCKKSCGIPCILCKEPCLWRCEHLRCTRKCGELCNRPPCNEPCKRLLKCEHPCIGFCGEPCPPLCRICNKDEVTEIFLGDEDLPDARFVYLVDCKHCIESKGLQDWVDQVTDEGKDMEVKIPQCPKCKMNIIKTLRYANTVKAAYRDVQKIKEKLFGSWNFINKHRHELIEQLKELANNSHIGVKYRRMTCGKGKASRVYDIIVSVNSGFTKPVETFFKTLFSQLQVVVNGCKVFLNKRDVEATGVKVKVLCQLWNTYKNEGNRTTCAATTNQLHLLIDVIQHRSRFSAEEVEGINLEMLRFRRLVQFYQLSRSSTSGEDYKLVSRTVNSIEKYSNDLDKKMETILKNLGSPYTDSKEFRMVVAAMGEKKGHWYKCRNGHYYVIGECGGAVQVAQCSECKERIGGTSHRLLETNSVATEIDGATRGAYDEAVHLAEAFFD